MLGLPGARPPLMASWSASLPARHPVSRHCTWGAQQLEPRPLDNRLSSPPQPLNPPPPLPCCPQVGCNRRQLVLLPAIATRPDLPLSDPALPIAAATMPAAARLPLTLSFHPIAWLPHSAPKCCRPQGSRCPASRLQKAQVPWRARRHCWSLGRRPLLSSAPPLLTFTSPNPACPRVGGGATRRGVVHMEATAGAAGTCCWAEMAGLCVGCLLLVDPSHLSGSSLLPLPPPQAASNLLLQAAPAAPVQTWGRRALPSCLRATPPPPRAACQAS